MPPTERDYYEVLGVGRSAGDAEIKRAYRKLAKQYHPDRNREDAQATARFKEAQRAYSVLSDPQQRAQYDRFGHAAVGSFATNDSGQRVYSWGGRSRINVEDLQDLFGAFGGIGEASTGPASVFEQFFGGRGAPARGRRRAQKGPDDEHAVNLSFEQAVHGTTVEVAVSGSDGQQTLSVKIPPGVDDGKRIRLTGKGAPGKGAGPPGDLYLVCRIRPHPYFRREGRDIYVDLPLTLSEAALGTRVEVPTIDGSLTVTVPPGAASGTRLRLKGRGVRGERNGAPGNQYVVVKIIPPKVLSDRQKELLHELEAATTENPREHIGWWREGGGRA